MRPLLARWLLCWLKAKYLKELTMQEALEYLLKGKVHLLLIKFKRNIRIALHFLRAPTRTYSLITSVCRAM
jgi:hypothetical protein